MSVARAIAALRGGRPIGVQNGYFLSLETGTAAMIERVDPRGEARLLISGARAAALGMANLANAADAARPVLLARSPWLDRASAMALADPANDFSRGPIGPLEPVAMTPHEEQIGRAAIAIAGRSGLLPALWWLPDNATGNMPEQVQVTTQEALVMTHDALVVARAKLPLAGISDSQIVAFRDAASGDEHVALIIGAFGGKPPLVRLHSECLTGDVFGSLKCDCGPQLHEALSLIEAEGGGVLLYLRQEGRGIGLANKIRAYQLQDRGLDTVDANRRLGFADDARDYGMAAAMLRALGIDAVRLLTNNPGKIDGLEAAGIKVVERVAHHLPTNPHNADYIATKQGRSGHL